MEDSLWPQVLFAEEPPIAPVQIMRQQADLLSKGLGWEIVGKVNSRLVDTDGWRSREQEQSVENMFQIVVPGLGDYTIVLFEASHSPTRLYPVFVTCGHLENHGPDDPEFQTNSGKASNPEQFKEILRRLFARPEVLGVIQTLRAQVSSPEARPPKRAESRGTYGYRRDTEPDSNDDDMPF